ncbi:MAG: APC family permease [Methanomassiliicoccales archaeon]|nr:APC family permease [Methanomassiliicoccales archaeon]
MTGSLRRSEGLGLWSTIAFAVGTMIGAGVFVLSGLVVNVAGSAAILSYIICGAIITLSGLSYASLASIFPQDGGGYLYAKRILGPFPGFLAGWGMYIFSVISSAFVLIGFGIYLDLLLGWNIDPRVFALIGLVLITALNFRGLAEAGRAELIMVATKVAILIGLVLFGLFSLKGSDLNGFLSTSSGGVFTGISMVFFAYTGFQVAAMMAGEVKESSKKVPLAIMASIGIVMFIYVGVIVALLSANLPSYGSDSVFEAAKVLIGPIGGTIIAIAAVISTLSSSNANMIGASRITMEMASEDQFPGRFAKLRKGQPINSILLGSFIMVFFILPGDLSLILDVTNVTILFTMVLVNVSAVMLCARKELIPKDRTYFEIPFKWLFPARGAVSCIVMIVFLPISTIVLGAGAILAGSVLYLIEDTKEGKMAIEEIRKLLGRETRGPPSERERDGTKR